METNYMKYRGKCKEECEKLVSENPSLKMVRGFYYCPIWNKEEPHWWCKDKDNNIIDPTVKQFPSGGMGEYTEFNGNVTCDNCGKVVKEEDAIIMGNYPACSNRCAGAIVGIAVS